MTLSSFKNRSKLSILAAFLIVYAAGFFVLGKYTNNQQISKLENILSVKGATDIKKEPAGPDSPVPYADTQSAKTVASFVKICSNTNHSFEVSYPKDWFTTYNTEDEKCTFFAPYAFTVPQTHSAESAFVPIRLEIATVDTWEETVSFYENANDFQNVISVQNLDIGGHAVKKVEAMSTSGGQIPKGFAKVNYLYGNSQVPIVATYQQTQADENVQERERILEDIVKSFKYY